MLICRLLIANQIHFEPHRAVTHSQQKLNIGLLGPELIVFLFNLVLPSISSRDLPFFFAIILLGISNFSEEILAFEANKCQTADDSLFEVRKELVAPLFEPSTLQNNRFHLE